MPLLIFDDFTKVSFEKRGRLLGCDLGEKTIGLALSDVGLKIASPFQVLQRTKWRED
ncbi:MAG TPA: Holliday junction resolvase RuvX, partial [Holosporales bacterium]|nr:Holliday junction resolvase RuvX [Holosporales bacterium]